MFKTGLGIFLLLPILFLFLGCSNKKSNEDEINAGSSKSLGGVLGDFYFVGMVNNNPGIYKFISKNKSFSRFWSNENEKVIDLSYSPDRKCVFFMTATDLGKQGTLPFIKNVKLYLINPNSSKLALIQKIGNGIQIFTAWETDNTFKIILNSFDKTVANYINQEVLIFSEFGRKLVDNSKTYDITKEGYPKPPSTVQNFISPKGEKLIAKIDSSEVLIYLSSKSKKTPKLITRTDQNLNDAEWSTDGKYLVFSTLDISPKNKTLRNTQPSTSKLYVYSLLHKRITKAWNGAGVKNFFIKNNYLIFDDGFEESSSIHIFNIKTDKPVYTIRIKGGCGLRNVPSVPIYGN